MTAPLIGVLALQGAFAEHIAVLEALGCRCKELRQASDITEDLDALVLPGGESTVQSKLLRELGMLEPLQEKLRQGLPVLATCAGLILLAEEVEGGQPCFATLPVTVQRNAFGRQLASFLQTAEFGDEKKIFFPMTFIRAPIITEIHSRKEPATALAAIDNKIVAVQYHRQLALAFHPELGGDTRVHQYFLQEVCGW